ncbi:MAG: hypothetical protein LBU22_02625 [Dysgonamonadaceae bacterium]|jgi:hypothetical protein|nr:hypothetical protein [Dysgonamonadaceae bacterium]
MKTKLFSFWAVLLIAVFGLNANAQVHVNASFYVNIPLAPNFNLEIGVNTHRYPAPHDRYVWVDDYYTWDYAIGRYVLVQGGWILPPYLDAIWIPGYWEYTPYGYRWMNACWLPQHYRFSYGFYKGRYDYYGRPVYYHKPHNIGNRPGYAYGYDHNPAHRGQNFSSSSFHNTPNSGRVSSANNRASYNNNEASRGKIAENKATSDRDRNSLTNNNNREEKSSGQYRNEESRSVNKETQSVRNSNVENKDRSDQNRVTSSSNERDRTVARTTPSSSRRESSGNSSSTDSKKSRSSRTR